MDWTMGVFIVAALALTGGVIVWAIRQLIKEETMSIKDETVKSINGLKDFFSTKWEINAREHGTMAADIEHLTTRVNDAEDTAKQATTLLIQHNITSASPE